MKPIQTSTECEFEGRFIGLTLKFQCLDSYGKTIKGKFLKIFLASVYHPYEEPETARFNNELNTILNSVPTNAEIIIGSDVNAKVGRRDCEENKRVLGPFGLDDRNEKGKDLLQIYMTNDMRVSNTFFDHSSRVTYESFNKDKIKSMHDICHVCGST